MIYAFVAVLFLFAAFMWSIGQLHFAHRCQVFEHQLDELIYNLAHAEQDVGEAEQEGG